MIVALVLLASTAPPVAVKPVADTVRYFPETFARPSYMCPVGDRRIPSAIMGDFENRWFSGHLAAAGEPSLYRRALGAGRGGAGVVRFTWLRSFHPPVIVRVERSMGGAVLLIAKELTGAGGYSPGRVGRTVERRLSRAEADGLGNVMARTGVMRIPPKDCRDALTLDGARWIIESTDRSGYHYADRTSPEGGPVHAFGLYMLRLTGWSFKQIY